VDLSEASRALAIKWIWLARDTKYSAFRSKAQELRAKVHEIASKMDEVDDWFYGKEMRLAGKDLEDEGERLREDQFALDDEMKNKIRITELEVSQFEQEKRDSMNKEIDIFNEILERERRESKQAIKVKETHLLEAKKAKEIEFIPVMLVNEHRAYLSKLDEDRRKEIESAESIAAEKEKQKKDAFDHKIALSETAIQNRKALTQHRLLSIRKESMNKFKMQENSWQNKATGWLEKAARKVAAKEQEDAENALAMKKRKKV